MVQRGSPISVSSLRFNLVTSLLAALLAAPLQGAVKAEDKPKVVIRRIQPEDDVRRLLYPAKVEAKMTSEVTADLDGHIRRIVKDLGATVRAGDVVLYLENRDPAFTYSAVPVRSPINGVISHLQPQVMAKVARGDRLFTVMNRDLLQISAEVPAADLNLLKAGVQGVFTVNGKEHPVRVKGLSPIVDPRTGTAMAEVEFLSAKDSSLLPPAGTVGRLSFELSSGRVMLIPENSLTYVGGKPTVRILDESNASRRRPVEIGEQREDSFVVRSGLQAGERVIVRASRTPKEGEEVIPEDPEAEKDRAAD